MIGAIQYFFFNADSAWNIPNTFVSVNVWIFPYQFQHELASRDYEFPIDNRSLM